MPESKTRKIVMNLSYVIFVGLFFVAGMEAEWFLKVKFLWDSQAAIHMMILKSVLPILTGIFLGLPHLARQFQTEGNWTYDWIGILTIAVPALIAAVYPILCFTIPVSFYGFYGGNTLISDTGGIVSGYIFLISAGKSTKSE